MKHGSFLMLVAAALPAIAGAQTSPPTPPTQPTQPTQPVQPVAPAPVVTPVAPTPPVSINGWIDRAQIDEIKRQAADFKYQADKMKLDADLAVQQWKTSVPFEFDSKFDFHFDPPHFDMPSINIPPIDVHVNVPSLDR